MGITTKVIDAAPHLNTWQQINWRQANKTVRRLQSRIVKAVKAGNYRKVRALQYIMCRSKSAAAMAVRQVTENTGRRTPGIDGQIWRTNRQKMQAVQQVRKNQYRAKPLRRIHIPKPNDRKKKRPLSIPCMCDRAKQALHLKALEPLAEYYADTNSYGFRKRRSAADAIAACNNALTKETSAQWILEADIKSCFDHLSQAWLLKKIPMNKKVLAQFLKAGYIDKLGYHRCETGAAQGGIISPALANLALDGLEALLKLKFKRCKVNFVRYADDFIITGESKTLLEGEVLPVVRKFLSCRGLKLSERKTRVIHISEGFDFLGFNIRKYGKKVITKPSKTSVRKLIRKIGDESKRASSAKTENYIRKLNPIIRGWANYYRHVKSGKTFSYVDHCIWKITWRWMRRKHNKKGKRWIVTKYVATSPKFQWVMKAHTATGKELKLLRCHDIPCRWHIKIKQRANPFDESYAKYFENRQLRFESNNFLRNKIQRKLWTQQQGKCLICNGLITQKTGWHMHHLKRRCDRGKTTLTNLVLLHPTCHEQWHQLDYERKSPGYLRKALTRA